MNDTPGFEAERESVAIEVDSHLADIADPLERYMRATAAQVHHQAIAAALQTERDKALATLNAGYQGTPRVTYEGLAELTALSRAGAQKAVERGRRALT